MIPESCTQKKGKHMGSGWFSASAQPVRRIGLRVSLPPSSSNQAPDNPRIGFFRPLAWRLLACHGVLSSN